MSICRRGLQIGLVAAGYVAAFLLASAVVAVRIANTSGPDAQASSGMYAAGDAMLFIAVFGVCALVPTGGMLFLLRPYHRFWRVLSALGVIVAATGVAAVVLFSVGRHETASALAIWAGFSVLRILIAPLFALAFLVCAAFAPGRSPRFTLLAATLLEAVTSAYGGFVWFVPLFFSRT